MRKRFGKILLLLAVICSVSFVCFYIYYISPREDLINTRKITVFLNGKDYHLNILTYEKDGQIEHDLVYQENIFSVTKVRLTGFEESVNLCQSKTVNLGGKIGDAICFINDVGVHSQNLELISFNQNRFLPIGFVDQSGMTSPNIFSDEPAIYLLDYYSNGHPSIIVGNRDYDNNPLVDSIRSYYKNDGEKFVFDKAVNFTYHNN